MFAVLFSSVAAWVIYAIIFKECGVGEIMHIITIIICNWIDGEFTISDAMH